MKKIYFLIIAVIITFNVSAQTKLTVKPDVIVKTNGDELKGKLTKITDDDVTFVYTGETVEYTIKKSDILKITHSSGRVETFSQTAAPAQIRQSDQVSMTATPSDHHNKIAILPFAFLMDNQPGAEEIGLRAQGDAYSYLSQHSAGYTILDPRTTNALLIKAGATKDKIAGFTMKELSDILGVEYIIDGAVMQSKAAETSSSSGYGSATVKRDGNKDIKNVSGYNSNNSYSQQRYAVSVSMHIFMDNNASIYNESHKAFWTNTDGSYSSPLEYLLKKCPLYRK
ncbi:hypothetical protein IDJ77_02315 [Mucilaginibacter sp. ZT4R22]|uniref:Uncharacterized protein n=1 Tax=Mucilaginibacter pankratovii TaxID=2772110 RepID=A0ABR7WMA4_9SPHI|nr:hypothetical protein [Mucilaginibacter pankratovii]MBD1362632.1 hypothetical protein [Mucilaginibacter pankratovii]